MFHTKDIDYNPLVSLKGLLILVVILFHAKGFFQVEYIPVVKQAIHTGPDYAVKYFFAISGFLITLGYKSKIAAGKVDFLHFMWSRIKKIYPGYIITNAIIIAIRVLQNGFIETINVALFLKTALMLFFGWFGNIYIFNFSTWFLCVLVQCYLIYYFIAKQAGKNKDLYYLLLGLITIGGYYLTIKSYDFPFLSFDNGESYFCFFTGSILCELQMLLQGQDEKTIRKVAAIGSISSTIIFAVFFAGARIYSYKVFTGNPVAANVIIIFPAIMLLCLYVNPVRKVLLAKPLFTLGKISVHIFLWHLPIFVIFEEIRNTFPIIQKIPQRIQLYFSLAFIFLFSYCLTAISEKRKKKTTH